MVDFKDEFIKNEILTATIVAGFSRGNVYKESFKLNVEVSKKFRDCLKEKLVENFNLDYSASSTEHIKEIENFAKDVSFEFNKYLADECFRIGTAQKIINLYLKYLWALGWLKKTPPHCPFDRIILDSLYQKSDRETQAKLKSIPAWTKMDDIEQYKIWVNAATIISNDNIAEWEIEEWQKMKSK